MSTEGRSNAGMILAAVLAVTAMAVLTTFSAYSTSIEHQLDYVSGEIMSDEDVVDAVLKLTESGSSLSREKNEFLSTYLKLSNNNLPEPDADLAGKHENEFSLSFREQNNAVKSIPEPEHQYVYEEKQISDNVYLGPSEENKNVQGLQDNEPDGEFKYSIQVKSFSQKAGAALLVRQLKEKNYDCFLCEKCNDLTDEILYRVFVGKFKDFQSAKNTCENLKKKNMFSDKIFVVNRSWVYNDQLTMNSE